MLGGKIFRMNNNNYYYYIPQENRFYGSYEYWGTKAFFKCREISHLFELFFTEGMIHKNVYETMHHHLFHNR